MTASGLTSSSQWLNEEWKVADPIEFGFAIKATGAQVVIMKEVEQIHHRASIAGYISDAVTQQAVSAVEVKLEDQALHPHNTKKVKTREDGFFYFLDLPDEQYDLSFLAPEESRRRYGGSDEDDPTARVSGIQVKSDKDGRPSFDPKATLKLSPTSLSGQVIDQKSDKPMFQATIKLLGSDIQTSTDPNGNYFLSGLQAGNPTVQISAKGCVAIIMSVTLIAGQETKLGKVGLVPS